MSASLINRLNDLKLLMKDLSSVGDIVNALEVASALAEDAVTEVVATELAVDQILEPPTDSHFLWDESSK